MRDLASHRASTTLQSVLGGWACVIAFSSALIGQAPHAGELDNPAAAPTEMGVSANPELAAIRVRNSELLHEARGFIGKPCAPNFPPENVPGFEPIPGFLPITVLDGYVQARSKEGRRFAFLLVAHADDASDCHIADVIDLPSAKEANAFLWCDGPDVRGPGVGMRLAGKPRIVDYWYIDAASSRLVPIDLGDKARRSTRCQMPESGE